MKIKTKMLLGGAFIAAVPVLIGCYILNKSASHDARLSLEQDAQQSLTAIRDITASQISNYITQIEQQAVTLAENLMVIEAMQRFSQDFKHYGSSLSEETIREQRQSVDNYYQRKFSEQFSELNNGQFVDTNTLLSPLDTQSIALQYEFISNNKHPLGSKHLLESPVTESDYALSHIKYHPVFRDYIDRFGYYDLFLVDHISGDIVYSVFKELDYSTSLIDGPYSDSGIGQAFARANTSKTRGVTELTDFAPYLPSYNAPASFIATPIFSGTQQIGILILQMPVDKINAVMTYDQKWQESGLGESGETYLVGPDFTMRSNGRFLIEDKTQYLTLMEDIGLAKNTIEQMDSKTTSIGLQPVKTFGTEQALKGDKGFKIFDDYRGIAVLSAYKPIEIGGLRWAILSEIDAEEAFAPVRALQEKSTQRTLVIVTAALILGPLLTWLMANTILVPLEKIVSAVRKLSDGEGDLTQRLAIISHDEVAELSISINHFVENLDNTFSELIKSTMRLIPMSEELSEGNAEIIKTSQAQNEQIISVQNHMQSAQESSDHVNSQSLSIFEESEKGVNTVEEGIRVFDETHSEINALGNIIVDASSSIDSLKTESDKIVSMINQFTLTDTNWSTARPKKIQLDNE